MVKLIVILSTILSTGCTTMGYHTVGVHHEPVKGITMKFDDAADPWWVPSAWAGDKRRHNMLKVAHDFCGGMPTLTNQIRGYESTLYFYRCN